ncbi:MAG: anhydro-N-acetylmuramic acid kinase [Oceanospirillaceae bacterium]|nr:anhydro-N-acetylmuramic acid kinase [Oceanospirillaceae bacterium]MCP5336063.1 anhydro-N-acetylmuramic acid kinase [Oceanospirillaceae bacterium]MCP5350246.1 anhydro-N-acetylmuramic acid kinase [Oceanospirillaceae bacterium]
MTGTSLDGLDTALCRWENNTLTMLHGRTDELPNELRDTLLSLCQSGADEINISQQAAWQLAGHYAHAVNLLLGEHGIDKQAICAIGCHGQTVRHQPHGPNPFTLQLNNAARIAELTGIDCITDFRSRDIAAGGQGAPLVPAFHAHWAGNQPGTAIVNIGGMANISLLQTSSGFDTGPGNVLMDYWCNKHLGRTYDANGAWAAAGQIIPSLLSSMLEDEYFARPAPKSTGREHFNPQWLAKFTLQDFAAQDVQSTLCEVTARSISDSLKPYAINKLIVCGGGAFNQHLLARLQCLLPGTVVCSSATLGIAPQFVEAAAFAWLAAQFTQRTAVAAHFATGAKGPRILGALYPA